MNEERRKKNRGEKKHEQMCEKEREKQKQRNVTTYLVLMSVCERT